MTFSPVYSAFAVSQDGGSGWLGVGGALGGLPRGPGLVTNWVDKSRGIELSNVAAQGLVSACV